MKISIQLKIIISFCLLICFMFVSVLVFGSFFSREYFIYQNKNELLDFYYKIENSYSDDEEILNELTANEDKIKGFSVQVFSENELIFSTRSMIPFQIPDKGRPESDRQLVLDEYEYNPEVKVINSENINNSMLLLQGKINYNNETRYINISKPLESIEESVDMFTQISFIICCAVLILGIIVIYFISKSITKPIKNIELISNKLSSLDFSYKVDENINTKELSNLAVSINSMSSQLESSINNLKLANIELQKDVDKQKQLELMRRQFIANVSHEMKTPLSLLQIYCENLKYNIDNVDKNEYCDIIIEETNRLDNIVRDMLNISNIENGLSKMEMKEFDLSISTEKLVNTMLPMLDEFDLSVEITPNININGDQKHIEEAMRNYIMNAISHTENNNKIKIKLSIFNNEIVFSVYNDGEKIIKEEMKNIWDSFYKKDKSRTRTTSANAGLGLYVVRVIVEKHNGVYGVTNKENGVEFYFTINLKS